MSEIIEQILTLMFEPEKRRLVASLDRLIVQHSGIVNKNVIGFLFNGTFYCHSAYKAAQAPLNSRMQLADALLGEMDAYLKDRKTILFDESHIRQTLHQLLKDAENLQDCRDRLPDLFSSLVPELRNYKRTKEYETMHSERTLRQANKVINKMYVYSVGNLIY